MFDFFKNKKILITGHTGFKGSWLTMWLSYLGADVCGYSLDADKESLFNQANIVSCCCSNIGDIRNIDNLKQVFNSFKPEIVFHLAAQPLVRLSYKKPIETYETNVMGTLNVLEAARAVDSVKAFVNITTDKCYENKEVNIAYKETDPMGGYDMYSSSNGCVEILSSSYCRSFLNNGYFLATARAGNVIGGGDWAVDGLIPDCMRYLSQNKIIEIRYPNAVRPWQHVLEPLRGYMILAQKLYENGAKFAQAYNFGPDNSCVLSVSEIVGKVISYWGGGNVKINRQDSLYEATLLMLDPKKAESELNWKCALDINKTIKYTVDWYKAFYSGCDMSEYTLNQIKEYEAISPI